MFFSGNDGSFNGNTANAVELTPSESISYDGYVTMSVEEFSELAESQGFIVVYEDEYFPKQRMAKYFEVELINNNFNYVGLDNNLLDETARVKVISLSSNITSLDVRMFEKHANEYVYSYN